MQLNRKLAATAVGILGLVGAGAGTAWAQASSTPSTPAPTVAPAPSANQQPAASAAKDAEKPDATETANETSAKEDPAEAGLPGGGHADPAGNVDHQFNGVE